MPLHNNMIGFINLPVFLIGFVSYELFAKHFNIPLMKLLYHYLLELINFETPTIIFGVSRNVIEAYLKINLVIAQQPLSTFC